MVSDFFLSLSLSFVPSLSLSLVLSLSSLSLSLSLLCYLHSRYRRPLPIVNFCARPETLEREVLHHLFLDFRIWIHTPISVQLELLKALGAMASARAPYFRAVIGVQQLLDMARTFYWFTPEASSYPQPS